MSRSLSALALLLLIVVIPGGCLLAMALLIYRRSKGVEVLVGSSAGDAAPPSVRTQYNDACPLPGPRATTP